MCSRKADHCRWVPPGNYYHFGLLRGAHVERGAATGEDGTESPDWWVVLETWGEPIATSTVPDEAQAVRFAAEVNAFVAGDAPELRVVWEIPGQRFFPISIFVSGVVLLLAWWVQTVRGSLGEVVRFG